jgi:hypothetical protein
VPASAVKGQATHDALAAEAGPLQRLLLGEVLDIGDGLESVGQGRGEQVLDQQSLRCGPQALAAVLGEQEGADLQQPASGPPVLMVRQLTIPAKVSSGRVTASWAESSPSQPSSSQRRRRARGLRKGEGR